mmetsp:Transcript_7561/g.18753  ORF Transcript_7561/g.18753 Transcript_7561/m.18753 type:complete len:248 (-) Transcript_7561:2208-2951(-)
MKLNAEQYAHDAWRCLEVVGMSEEHVMEPSRLQGCKGFLLLTSKKTAFLGTVETGHGILIECRELDDRARRVYSAPVPVTTTRIGMGTSMGYEKLYSIMLLKCHEAVKHIANGGGLEGSDAEVPHASKDKVHHTHKHHRTVMLDCDLMPGENEATVFSASKGVMIADMSFSGGSIGPDKKLIAEWYGEGVRPNDILASKDLVPPAAFDQLYNFLRDLEGEGVPDMAPCVPATSAPAFEAVAESPMAH